MATKAKNSTPSSKIGSNPKPGNKSSTEPLKCTGKFKDDFDNLCQLKMLKFIPEVVSRSKRPGSSLQNIYINQQQQQQQNLESSLAKNDKKASNTSRGKQVTVSGSMANFDNEHDIEQNPEYIDLPPKSFVIKDTNEYFKPKIQVEMDNPDKLDTVTEIHIKGFKLEKSIIEILNLCLPSIDQLHTLNLWSAGLDEESVRMISSMLPNCSNLKTLILDNNPISNPVYHCLLYEENSNIQNLSLRNNLINDEAAQYISCALGELKRSNTKLLTLNLNCNLIGDNGAVSIAKALRTNRTLLVLNLANNNIGDIGAKALADVISRFALTFEEIIHRRYVMSGRSFDKSTSPSSRKGNDSKDRPNSQKSNNHANLNETKSKKDKEKDKNVKKSNDNASTVSGTVNNTAGATKNSKDTLTKTKKDDKFTRKASVIDTKASKSVKPSSKTGKRFNKENEEFNDLNKTRSLIVSENRFAALLEISPLTDLAEYVDDNLWLLGNRNLLSLNLSRNEMTEKSVNNFLLALQYQKTFIELHKSQGTGLLRLVLTLLDFMKQRDPLYKANLNNLDSESTSGKESSLGRHTKSGKH